MPHWLIPSLQYIDVNGTLGAIYIQPRGQIGGKSVVRLDRKKDSYYDMNQSPTRKFDNRRDFWYNHGFGKNVQSIQDIAHELLLPYGLMKFKGGTVIVSLTAT